MVAVEIEKYFGCMVGYIFRKGKIEIIDEAFGYIIDIFSITDGLTIIFSLLLYCIIVKKENILKPMQRFWVFVHLTYQKRLNERRTTD